MPFYPGRYKMVCDRCGAEYLDNELREEWTGLWVCDTCWDPKHPQLSVVGIPDDQSVPIARPEAPHTYGETTLSAGASSFAASVTLTSASGLEQYDPIQIVLNDGTVHNTFIMADPAAGVVQLNTLLPSAADSGNTVYLPTINNY